MAYANGFRRTVAVALGLTCLVALLLPTVASARFAKVQIRASGDSFSRYEADYTCHADAGDFNVVDWSENTTKFELSSWGTFFLRPRTSANKTERLSRITKPWAIASVTDSRGEGDCPVRGTDPPPACPAVKPEVSINAGIEVDSRGRPKGIEISLDQASDQPESCAGGAKWFNTRPAGFSLPGMKTQYYRAKLPHGFSRGCSRKTVKVTGHAKFTDVELFERTTQNLRYRVDVRRLGCLGR